MKSIKAEDLPDGIVISEAVPQTTVSITLPDGTVVGYATITREDSKGVVHGFFKLEGENAEYAKDLIMDHWIESFSMIQKEADV